MMFRIKGWQLGAVLAVGTFMGMGCSTMSVKTNYDQSTNFRSLRTYAWLPNQPEIKGDSRLNYAFIEQHVKQVVDRDLASKGFTLAPGQADFLVGFHVSLKDKMDKTLLTRPDEESYEPGAGVILSAKDEKRWAVREPEPEYEIRNYEQGRLRLVFQDAATGRDLWSGRVKAEVEGDTSKDAKKLQIEKTVKRVLSHFPPRN